MFFLITRRECAIFLFLFWQLERMGYAGNEDIMRVFWRYIDGDVACLAPDLINTLNSCKIMTGIFHKFPCFLFKICDFLIFIFAP